MKQSDDHLELAELLDPLLSNSVPQTAPDPAARIRMRQRMMQRINAGEPEGTRTIRSTQGSWTAFLPGVDRKLLLEDDGSGMETALYRLQPGGTLPSHEHTHLEECWVLEGSVLVGDYPVFTGDMHIAYPGYSHDKIVAPGGAMLLIKSQSYSPDPTVSDGPTSA